MSDRLIPELRLNTPRAQGAATARGTRGPANSVGSENGSSPRSEDGPPRRELDLRRTAAPDPGMLAPARRGHRRLYDFAIFDQDGRLASRALFDILGWTSASKLEFGSFEGAMIVRTGSSGTHRLTRRGTLLVPAPWRNWFGFSVRERVLLTAVPSLSALIVYGQEKLARVLPDPHAVLRGTVPLDAPRPETRRTGQAAPTATGEGARLADPSSRGAVEPGGEA